MKARDTMDVALYCWGRSAPPKNEVAGIAGIYKQRVVSDS